MAETQLCLDVRTEQLQLSYLHASTTKRQTLKHAMCLVVNSEAPSTAVEHKTMAIWQFHDSQRVDSVI